VRNDAQTGGVSCDINDVYKGIVDIGMILCALKLNEKDSHAFMIELGGITLTVRAAIPLSC